MGGYLRGVTARQDVRVAEGEGREYERRKEEKEMFERVNVGYAVLLGHGV